MGAMVTAFCVALPLAALGIWKLVELICALAQHIHWVN
jgi:hypothetical protein